MVVWIAQAKSIGPYVTWIGVMMGALALVTIAILAFRTRVLGKDSGGDQGGMLDDLRAMRDRGEISPEEFDAAKAAMISRLAPARVSGATPPKPAPASKPRPAGGLVARPGFDLTGEPLPKPPGESPDR